MTRRKRPTRMSYHKMTTIHGHKATYVEPTAPRGTDERWSQIEANQAAVYISVRDGHWKPLSAAKAARHSGVVGPVEVTYSTGDLSGRGYGGYDKKFSVSASDEVTEIPLSDYQVYYDDAGDVNELWDEAEAG
jgi:hypothetical protein